MYYPEYLKNTSNKLSDLIEKHSINKIMIYIIFSGTISGLLLGIIEFIERSYTLGYVLNTSNKLLGITYSSSHLAIYLTLIAIVEASIIGIVLYLFVQRNKLPSKYSNYINNGILYSSIFLLFPLIFFINTHCIEKFNHTFISKYILQTKLFSEILIITIILTIIWFITTLFIFNKEENENIYLKKYLIINISTSFIFLILFYLTDLKIILFRIYEITINLINSIFIFSNMLGFLTIIITGILLIYAILHNTIIAFSLLCKLKYSKEIAITLLFISFSFFYLFIMNFLFTHYQYDLFIRTIHLLCLIPLLIFFQLITILLMNYSQFKLTTIAKIKNKTLIITVFIIISTLFILITIFKPNNNVLKAFIHRNILFHQILQNSTFPTKGKIFTTIPTDNLCKQNNSNMITINNKEKPPIFMFSIDALKSSMADDKNIMPNLNNLKKDSYYFENCYSHGSHTIASLASMNLSKYFSTLKEFKDTTLAEKLVKEGYETFAFSGNNFKTEKISMYSLNINDEEKLTPITRGYNNIYMADPEIEHTSKADTKTVNEFIKTLKNYNFKKPIFAWVHLFRPHETPIEFVFQSFLSTKPFKNEYKSRVKETDKNLGRLIKNLKEKNLYNKSLIIFFADHGDEIKEHGGLYHKYSLYNEMIKVPLLIKMPYQKNSFKIKTPVSLLDIYPTIQNYVNIRNTENYLCGDSLLGMMLGIKTEHKYSLGAMYLPKSNITNIKPFKTSIKINNNPPTYYYERIYKYSIIDNINEWKLIYNLYPEYYELYNLKTDPTEKNNLADKHKDKLNYLLDRLQKQITK